MLIYGLKTKNLIQKFESKYESHNKKEFDSKHIQYCTKKELKDILKKKIMI